jgi:N-acetylneuraminate synthase
LETNGFSEQWKGIKQHCDTLGLDLFPLVIWQWIGWKKLVEQYKIGSGEVTNFLILEKIAQTGNPILSSGMSSYAELDQTVDF